jgi:hypothetical protein
MKESHRKGVATHPDHESCVASRKAATEALTGAPALAYEPGGRKFESCRAHQINNLQPRIFARRTVVNNSITIVLRAMYRVIPHVAEMTLFWPNRDSPLVERLVGQ